MGWPTWREAVAGGREAGEDKGEKEPSEWEATQCAGQHACQEWEGPTCRA